MNITVVGSGYVGLVTATCFAEMGNRVIGVDIDEQKVKKLSSGEVTIYEPGLETLFERNIKAGRISFTTDLEPAIDAADVVFLALPTPPGADGAADLKFVLGVAKQLGHILKSYKVIVNKSTVPVGTADLVRQAIAENATVPFDVVSNPEFLREGVAVEDFMKPDRVVVGTQSPKAANVMSRLYEPFVRQGNPIYLMDERSAEMTKYAANAYLATRITFMNEIANLCEKVGADVDMVRKGMGSDHRIGRYFLYPGVGFGGSCFPKDVSALGMIANKYAYDFRLLKSVISVNEHQRIILVDKIKDYFSYDLKGKHFAMWGLAFKANTDDIREASALYIIKELLDAGATVSAFDPQAMDNTRQIYGDQIQYAGDPYVALNNADALIIVTEWQEFRVPNFDSIGERLKNKVIFDGRNLYNLNDLRQTGFYYQSIGRPTVKPE
ncbi:MAG: UDP-glucose/GDP-mannose dehydrogenase family protein [Chitinophagales bacterium]|jgi:UDPglucose 6-dehydrogenase|nr:UDP-glucose/GDP-mannose dehydrogenase family protein [Chitinophagales bacterium]HNI43799.1 UDP-glucose/GDP-mannose dehydrogenase family protein [Chitinophagales bacterium]